MRSGEALCIKKRDLDFSLDRIIIRIKGEYTKTQIARTTFVSKECEEKIMSYFSKLDDDEIAFTFNYPINICSTCSFHSMTN